MKFHLAELRKIAASKYLYVTAKYSRLLFDSMDTVPVANSLQCTIHALAMNNFEVHCKFKLL